MSLLNLSGLRARFGPLSGLWEGGDWGEGGLREVKASYQNGLRGAWQLTHTLRLCRAAGARLLFHGGTAPARVVQRVRPAARAPGLALHGTATALSVARADATFLLVTGRDTCVPLQFTGEDWQEETATAYYTWRVNGPTTVLPAAYEAWVLLPRRSPPTAGVFQAISEAHTVLGRSGCVRLRPQFL